MKIHQQLIDLHRREIYPAEITIAGGRIKSVTRTTETAAGTGFILPGFVDAHVHIESSMLPPAEFARLAVVHGTVATVSDPHEIANVIGVAGVEFMLAEARKVPLKFCFGAPSCVPATTFETAGDALNARAVEDLLQRPDIGYLSEMMNFPGVLSREPEVMAKLAAAKRLNKPIDGHAPGLRGTGAVSYFSAGITTDHECFTYEEGKEKAELGVKILIREGSAAKNFAALWPLLKEYPAQVMFCSDDKHPDDLIQGHINQLVARALAKGCDLFDVLRAACLLPVEHYRLPVGLLREGDPADFILVDDLATMKVSATWINGRLVAEKGQSLLPHQPSATPNRFRVLPKENKDFALPASRRPEPATSLATVRVIQVLDGEIVTKAASATVPIMNGLLQVDPEQDVLKIAVVNRYAENAPPAVGFVRGTGLKNGALASSVAHDSHNIVAIGTSDEWLCLAVNEIIRAGGGIAAVGGKDEAKVLPLPIAGLMSPQDGYVLAEKYAAIDQWAKKVLGCTLKAPFMTLSFLALPVIPSLKMTDLGLFDVDSFGFTAVELHS